MGKPAIYGTKFMAIFLLLIMKQPKISTAVEELPENTKIAKVAVKHSAFRHQLPIAISANGIWYFVFRNNIEVEASPALIKQYTQQKPMTPARFRLFTGPKGSTKSSFF